LEKFSSFITEQKEESYRLIVFNNSNEDVRDVGKRERPDFKLYTDSAKKVGIEIFNVEYTGLFVSESNGKLFINSFEFDDDGVVIMPTESGGAKYQKPIEINPDNTLIFARGLGTFGYTTNRRWVDIIRGLEDKQNNLRIPITVPITYSDDSERAVKEGGLKFPLILKSSSGSQTGVGVIIMESMKSLHPTVQMLSFLQPYVDLLVQEYIKIDYDIRVLVVNGEVLASMRRNVMDDDIRSNASLGAKTESIELTDMEKETAIKVAQLVDGDLVGVDLLPAKDREKEQPYILEVNATPGLGGIEEVTKDKSVTQEILKIYMNRENWK
jgi:D-alanine-D-alanine ligase-like ATP-grasp enzyme